MRNERLLLATLASPLVMPSMVIILAIYQGMPIGEIQLSLLFYIPAAYLAAAIFGTPIFWFYRIIGWERVVAYIMGGTFIGGMTGWLIGLMGDRETSVAYFAFCLSAGALSALVFWFVLNSDRKGGAAHVSVDGEI